jgi:lipoprotein signal peptidase
MLTTLMMTGRTVAAPLMSYVTSLHGRFNNWLVPAESMPRQGTGSDFPTWVIVLGFGVFLIVCALPACAVVAIAILTLLGPAIGNTFSNIQ